MDGKFNVQNQATITRSVCFCQAMMGETTPGLVKLKKITSSNVNALKALRTH
jgi:hypothetical protein